MKRSWIGILLVLLGSLPIGQALQYYFAGEPYRNTPTRNWLVVGQVILGLAIIAYGLYTQVKASRQPVEEDESETKLNLRD